jgi:hypothetical protein
MVSQIVDRFRRAKRTRRLSGTGRKKGIFGLKGQKRGIDGCGVGTAQSMVWKAGIRGVQTACSRLRDPKLAA